ncbi:MAG: hypothetical protein K1000chlam4_00402, partial [Chlamydiae bacterium]|nr:hypothetical protein [Chlamydiota bacterium]
MASCRTTDRKWISNMTPEQITQIIRETLY